MVAVALVDLKMRLERIPVIYFTSVLQHLQLLMILYFCCIWVS